MHKVRCYNCRGTAHYAKDCPLAGSTQGNGRLINIDGNAHASAFQLSDMVDDVSHGSYNSIQDMADEWKDMADEWNSYYF